jgi:hypothetical protein
VGVDPGGQPDTDAGTIVLSRVEETNDPGTIVVGTVLDDAAEAPVPGARVHVFTSFDVFPALTASDGTFAIANVPTTDGDLFASVSAQVNGIAANGEAFATPLPGGVTDFGTIVVRVGGGVEFLLPPFMTPRIDLRLAAMRRDGPMCAAFPGAAKLIRGGL